MNFHNFNNALEKAQKIQNETEGSDQSTDPYLGAANFQINDDGPADFQKLMDTQFKPKD